MGYSILTLAVLMLLVSALVLFKTLTSTRYKVLRLLKKHNVPFDRWESDGKQDNLNRLIESVEEGEIEMESRPDGTLVLHVYVAVATLRHNSKRGLYELREYRKKGPDGLLEARKFSGSLGGKIKRKSKKGAETPLRAIQRELAGELGESESRFKDVSEYTLEHVGSEVTEPQPSDNGRIGLLDVYHREHFKGEVNGLYRHTYVERHTQNETRQFFWVKV